MVTIAQIITIALLVLLGGGIFIQRPRSMQHLGFFVFCLTMALWIIAGMLSNVMFSATLLANKLVFVVPLMAIWAAFWLVGLIVNKYKVSITALGLILVGFSMLTLSGNYIVAGITPGSNGVFNIIKGPFYFVYVAIVIIAASVILGRLFIDIRKSSRRQHDQLAIIALGFLTSVVLGLVVGVLLPILMGTSAPAQFAFLSGLALTGSFAFAIVRHSLFDIKQTVVRSAAYGLSIVTLAAIYYALAYFVSVTLFRGQVSQTVSVSPVNIILALALAFVFQPIKNFFDRVTDRIFFRERYNTDEFYSRLSEVLTTTTDLRSLLQKAAREISDTLKAEQAFFFVKYSHVHRVTAGTLHHTELSEEGIHDLEDHIIEMGSDVIVAELVQATHRHLHRMMSRHKIAIILPLMSQEKAIGYLALGEQQSSGYTNRDITTLRTISDELVIAIQNSLSVQEVKDINANLEHSIKAATTELRSSNARLRRLDATKDEFISMASHQLRTPLTSVKGYIDMVLEGDVGEITDLQRKLLAQAFESSERMVHLIDDFLNVSRLQTGKFMLETRPTNLATVVEQEVAALKGVAKSHNLRLSYRQPRHFPDLLCDEGKIRQVVMNFIDNAIYYSRPSGVIEVKLATEGSDVVFEVHDNGIGVPKPAQAQLFTKFFRADNARKQRPDGTGVGLYLARKVVDAHNGQIIFHSEEGKGSVFGFRLSLVKLAVEKADNTNTEQDNS